MINKFISGLKPAQRKWFAAGIVLTILALFFGVFLFPAWKRSQDIDSRIVKEQDTVRKNTKFLSRRDKAVKEAAVFKDYFTKDARSEDEIIAELLKKVELMATKSGVQASKLTPAGQDVQTDYIKFLVSVDCSGTLENLTNFVYAINTSRELIKVEKMNLASNAKSPDAISASFTISRMVIGADPSVEASKLVILQKGKEAAKPAATPKE